MADGAVAVCKRWHHGFVRCRLSLDSCGLIDRPSLQSTRDAQHGGATCDGSHDQTGCCPEVSQQICQTLMLCFYFSFLFLSFRWFCFVLATRPRVWSGRSSPRVRPSGPSVRPGRREVWARCSCRPSWSGRPRCRAARSARSSPSSGGSEWSASSGFLWTADRPGIIPPKK